MLRPWPFHIVLDHVSGGAVHLQIVQAVVAGIAAGRLAPGDPLPGSRDLAKRLEVNRKTIQLAYDELIAQGRVVAQGRRGTFVAERPPAGDRRLPDRGVAACETPAIRSRARAIPPPPAPGMLVFDDGAPDTRLIPVAALARAYRGALLALSRGNRLADEHTLGSPALRRSIATMLNFDRGMSVEPDRICLTRGSQMAIFLAVRILAAPGEAVVMEEPGYPQARAAFRNAGAEVISLPVDAQGLVVEALEEVCRRRRIRCVYVTPHHQYPTTVSLSPDRRRRLIELSGSHGFTVIEDDYDHEFHFTRRPILPLASAYPDTDIVYLGSFSKLVSPSLRMGYIAAPDWFVRQAAQGVAQIDRQGDPAMEAAIAELIDSGEIHRHFAKAMRVYAQRRQTFATLLTEHFGPAARFTMPEGGLAYWVEFGAPFGTAAFAAKARAAGVRLLPGKLFSGARGPLHATRIGYAHLTSSEIGEGLRRLSRAVRGAGGV